MRCLLAVRPSPPRAPVWARTAALALLAAGTAVAHAAEFPCDNPPLQPPAFIQIDAHSQALGGEGSTQVGYTHCRDTAQAHTVDIANTDQSGRVKAASTADFGLQTVTAVLNAASLQGNHGTFAIFTLDDANVDVITATAFTTLVLSTRFIYTASTDGYYTDSSSQGTLRVDGPLGRIDHTDLGTADGSGDTSFSTAVLTLNPGQTLSLRTGLDAAIHVMPNNIFQPQSGTVTLNASYQLGIVITNAGGAVTTASGHDYSPSAVPEPGSWALMLGGLAAVLARRRSRR